MSESTANTRKTSSEIYAEALQVIPGGVSRNTVFHKPHPYYASHAKGAYVTDIDGVRRVDFANNMASLIHGHAYDPIVEAVIAQLQRGTAFTMATEIEVAYAQLLTRRVASVDKIRFVNSGTEAVMAMMKAARAYTGKAKIAKAEGAYHGTYDFAEISQTSNPSNWGDPHAPNSVPLAHGTPPGVLSDMLIFPFNDIETTLAILDAHADDIAAVLIDPVPHRVGLSPASNEYIEALYAWTQKNGALLLFDEVVTFRVGYGGTQERYTVKPDLTAFGKIIGGGFPVGAFGGRADVMEVLNPHQSKLLFPHSGTFSANPITLTAGYVAMEHYHQEAVSRLNELSCVAMKQVEEAIQLAQVPVSITGAGSMFRVHLRPSPPVTYREAYQKPEVVQVIAKMLDYLFNEEKMMMINTCSVMLSTVMNQTEIDYLSEALLKAFRTFKPEIEAVQSKEE